MNPHIVTTCTECFTMAIYCSTIKRKCCLPARAEYSVFLARLVTSRSLTMLTHTTHEQLHWPSVCESVCNMTLSQNIQLNLQLQLCATLIPTSLVGGVAQWQKRRSRTANFLSHARLSADGWPFMWVNHPLEVSQPGQLSLSGSINE